MRHYLINYGKFLKCDVQYCTIQYRCTSGINTISSCAVGSRTRTICFSLTRLFGTILLTLVGVAPPTPVSPTNSYRSCRHDEDRTSCCLRLKVRRPRQVLCV